jgi:dihydroxy-acid dehydratase
VTRGNNGSTQPSHFADDGGYEKVVGDLRHTIMRGLGFRDSDLQRPLIAVIHGWSEITTGHLHLRPLAEQVKQGVLIAGGQPAEVIVPGICGSVSGGAPSFRYNLPYRDFAAAMVETMLALKRFDGAVLIPTCDNVVPAYLMGAARVNIPSILLCGGYARPACYQGQPLTMMDTQRVYGRFLQGQASEEDIDYVVHHACTGPGSCPEMGTANTMTGVAEALGMTFPGNGSMAADELELMLLAKTVGERAVGLVHEGVRPSDIISPAALHNAMRFVLAVGGSPNAVVHLPALAKELNIPLPLELWDEFSRQTPLVARVRPNHPTNTMVEFEAAGGVPAVLSELAPLLALDVLTATGLTLRENIQGAHTVNESVIRHLADPFAVEGGLAVLKGTLAPEGAILKTSAMAPEMQHHSGPARVFDSEEDAIAGLKAGRIHAGDVVVVRYEGPRGAPGAREVYHLAIIWPTSSPAPDWTRAFRF